jgi:hypothetical protein
MDEQTAVQLKNNLRLIVVTTNDNLSKVIALNILDETKAQAEFELNKTILGQQAIDLNKSYRDEAIDFLTASKHAEVVVLIVSEKNRI